MKTCITTLKSTSPYGQNAFISPYQFPKKEKELSGDYERRTWVNRAHIDDDDNVFIPPMALKNCIDSAAQYLNIQIPGKGKSTYAKKFTSGVAISDPVIIGKRADIKENWLNLPSDGVRGGGKRVEKCIPSINKWGPVDVTWFILDDIITETVFIDVLQQAGLLIGIGNFRPQNHGYWGRFEVLKHTFKES